MKTFIFSAKMMSAFQSHGDVTARQIVLMTAMSKIAVTNVKLLSSINDTYANNMAILLINCNTNEMLILKKQPVKQQYGMKQELLQKERTTQLMK